MSEERIYDVIIAGAGPAGMTAARLHVSCEPGYAHDRAWNSGRTDGQYRRC